MLIAHIVSIEFDWTTVRIRVILESKQNRHNAFIIEFLLTFFLLTEKVWIGLVVMVNMNIWLHFFYERVKWGWIKKTPQNWLHFQTKIAGISCGEIAWISSVLWVELRPFNVERSIYSIQKKCFWSTSWSHNGTRPILTQATIPIHIGVWCSL